MEMVNTKTLAKRKLQRESRVKIPWSFTTLRGLDEIWILNSIGMKVLETKIQTRSKGSLGYYVSKELRLSLLNFSSTLEHAITNVQTIKIDSHWTHQFLSMLVLIQLAKTKWHVILLNSNKDFAPETKVSTSSKAHIHVSSLECRAK
jgi:hypothetical protein